MPVASTKDMSAVISPSLAEVLRTVAVVGGNGDCVVVGPPINRLGGSGGERKEECRERGKVGSRTVELGRLSCNGTERENISHARTTAPHV